MEKLVTMILKGIPGETKKKFKILCIRRGVSMQSELIRLMKKEVKDA